MEQMMNNSDNDQNGPNDSKGGNQFPQPIQFDILGRKIEDGLFGLVKLPLGQNKINRPRK